MKTKMAKLLSLCVLLLFTGCATFHLDPCQNPVNLAKAENSRIDHASKNDLTVAKPDIDVKVLTKTVSSWDGSRLPNYPDGSPEITILRIRVQPGVSLAMHQHPVINAGVLLKGQLTVLAEDGAILHLKAGDGIVELVDKWHYGRNDGETPAEIIVFYAGTQDAPITVYQKKTSNH